MSIAKSGNGNSYLDYISNVKAIAILMVIFLHSVSPLFYLYGTIDIHKWYTTVIYDSFVRSAVPLFLLANGVTVLTKDYAIKDWIINKILKRLILPFLLFYLLVIVVKHRPISSFFILTEIGYWFPFFGTILTLYLLYPIIRVWLKHTQIQWINYFIIIWFVSTLIKFYMPNFTLFSPNFIYGHIGFPIMGYLLSKINTKKYSLIGLLVYLFSTIIIIVLTIFISAQNQAPYENYFNNLSPFVISMSIGLFIFIKNLKININNKYLLYIRNFLSNNSYGIYLLHPLIIERFYFLHDKIDPLLSDWIIFILGIFITSLIFYIFQKTLVLSRHINKVIIIKNTFNI